MRPVSAPGTRAHELSVGFASNYTALLVQLHGVFNGAPHNFTSTLRGMYALGGMAIEMMRTHDPRFPANVSMGVGPAWQYVPSSSEYERRAKDARR